MSEAIDPFVVPPAIEAIDTTLDRRSLQIDDLTVRSYTLGLLRDPNEAGKKLGQESAEVMMAVYGEDTPAIEAELADMIYAGLVAARSHGKPARLGRILAILAARNKDSFANKEAEDTITDA